MIDEREYARLYRQINGVRDIDRLARKGYKREFLEEILTLKLGRETKRKFYRLPRRKIVNEWKSGKSIVSLAREYVFSPVMLAYILLQELGYSKNKAKAIVNRRLDVEGKRLKKELEEAWKADPVYSPEGLEKQYAKGEKGETRIKNWLERHGVKFEREEDLKKKYSKTPDFLLKKLIKIHGEPVRWIESKYSIGDMEKVRRDYRKQLDDYLHMFGPGAIMYHLGVLPSAKKWLEERGVLVLERLPRKID